MRTDHPRTERDFEQLLDLLGAAFFPGAVRWRSVFRGDAKADPGVRPHYLRVARRRGRIVAHVGIYEKPIRLGAVTLRMGGIGAVSCDPRYRRQGLAAVCMEDALEVMRREGLPVTTLLGIERYYLRFGYIGCWPGYALKLAVADLDKLRAPLKARPYAPGDLPALADLYNAAAAETPSSVVRDAARMKHGIRRLQLAEKTARDRDGALWVFHEPRGRRVLRAYAAFKEGKLLEAGMAPDDEGACAAVLAWLRQRQVEALEKDVALHQLCPTHPLWRYARRFNHATEGGLRWTASGMGRILDVPRFLETVRPEFEARLSRAGLERPVRLGLDVDGAKYGLALNAARLGGVAASNKSVDLTLSATQQSLFQMVLGTLPYTEIPGVAAGGAPGYLRALFPESSPHLYRLDWF
ncbi:MAG: GNAT family N-acetyltransferase [Planctomycetota bacterium]|nr:GNAT family N-acetyltransferase [Planctomycetota bacterium]